MPNISSDQSLTRDAESLELTGRFLLANFVFGNIGIPSLTNRFHELLQNGSLSFANQFDRSIWQVPDESRYLKPMACFQYGISESHTLDIPTKKDLVSAQRISRFLWM